MIKTFVSAMWLDEQAGGHSTVWHDFDDPDEMAVFYADHDYQTRVEAVGPEYHVRHTGCAPSQAAVQAASVIETTGYKQTQTPRMIRASHAAESIQFFLRLSGNSVISTRDDTFELRAGTAMFVPTHRHTGIASGPGQSITVAFDPHALRRVLGGPAPAQPMSIVPLAPVLDVAMRQMMDLDTDADPMTRTALDNTVADLIATATLSQLHQRAVAPTGREALRTVMLADVRNRLDDPELGPEDLARRHHISLRYVHSLFRDVGVPPATYIREQRLEAAAHLLAQRPGDSISGIAARCGFYDASNFTRIFRREFGVTPRDYRAAAAHTLTPLFRAGPAMPVERPADPPVRHSRSA